MVGKFYKWGDLGTDEEFIMKQLDIGHECKPRYDTIKTKKVSQVLLDIKYSIQLDQIREKTVPTGRKLREETLETT